MGASASSHDLGLLEKWLFTMSSRLTEIGLHNFIEAVDIWRGTPITGIRLSSLCLD